MADIAFSEEGGRIPVLDAAGYAVKLTDGQRCRWCGGSGYLEEFRHLLGGVCFRCFGTGVRFVHRYSREEAWRYGQRIYRQWLDYHEARTSRFYVPRFTSAAQVRDWLLDMNEEQ